MRATVSAVLAALVLSACAADEGPAPTKAERSDVITSTAVVDSIDMKSREVRITTADGRKATIVAGPEVRNLAQLEPGDMVRASYYESVAVVMTGANNAQAPSGAAVVQRAPEGQKPGAAAAQTINMIVEFVSYDPQTNVAVIILPNGVAESVLVRPEMRNFASARRPGEKIDLTMTRAVALTIDQVS